MPFADDATPTERDAVRLAERVLGAPVRTSARFPTGLAHFVYDVDLADGRRVVVRLTRPQQRRMFEGAVHWYARLKPFGVPLPALLFADPRGGDDEFPALVLDRLPGADLGEVYPALTGAEKRAIAREVAEIQRRVATLPPGPGFGFAWTDADPLAPTWEAAIQRSLARCRARLRTAGLVDEAVVDRIDAALARHRDYLARVAPTCTLDDLTTKNVIVDEGRLSGIVDVDAVFYGDPLVAPALTRMSLLAQDFDTEYVDAWLEAIDATPEQRRALDLYTAWFCVVFLSEFGHAFNQETAPPTDPAELDALLHTLDSLLAAF